MNCSNCSNAIVMVDRHEGKHGKAGAIVAKHDGPSYGRDAHESANQDQQAQFAAMLGRFK